MNIILIQRIFQKYSIFDFPKCTWYVRNFFTTTLNVLQCGHFADKGGGRVFRYGSALFGAKTLKFIVCPHERKV